MRERKESDGPATPVGKPLYESPGIDEIVTPAELEREVHYAGFPSLGR